MKKPAVKNVAKALGAAGLLGAGYGAGKVENYAKSPSKPETWVERLKLKKTPSKLEKLFS